ncbi:CRISPR-associated protein Cas4 [Alicyclobacillaceae bacterium I2511]|nr:CRISPR-associated protein Cas4 [Alicyclobacillaceae bacterium I2511]
MREWDELDLVPLSALQHYSYCPRQYGLIYLEQVWDENIYTMKGRWAHERADEEADKLREDVQILTALPVGSDLYGLVGKCDVVELHNGIPYPVEYKHGRLKSSIHDELQLCGQALCLEEMFGVPVVRGVVYHISSKHRREVEFTPELRRQVWEVAEEIRELNASGVLPQAVYDARCTDCSLQESCMPEVTDGHLSQDWADWSEAKRALAVDGS